MTLREQVACWARAFDPAHGALKASAWALLCAALAGCLLLGLQAVPTYAQEPEPWTLPVQLSLGLVDASGQPLSSAFPTLVADPWGGVHAFWPESPRQQDTSQDGILMYSRWDGSAWSPPVDILYSKGRPMRLPIAALDSAGRVHLVWTVGAQGPVWYSSAPVSQAGSALAWDTPQQVSDLSATGFGLAADATGRSHVVFCTGDEDDRCYYSSSSDGQTWTAVVAILNPCDDCVARVAIDGRGRIHAALGSQSTGGQAMYYARSLDGGQTWLPALEFDRVDGRFGENYGPTYGTVVTLGADQVHFIWDGAPAGQRWYRWSSDGGETWSQPQQISPDHRGLTLPVAAAFDSAGTLHLVSMGWRDLPGRPSGAFHLFWQNGKWSLPQLIGPRSDWDAEYSALAITGGNRLVAAWTDKLGPKESFQIWASSLKVDAPTRPPQPEPTPLAPVAVASPGAEQAAARTSSATSAEGGTEQDAVDTAAAPSPTAALAVAGPGIKAAQPPWWPLMAGVLPVVLVLLLFLIVRMSRQGRT